MKKGLLVLFNDVEDTEALSTRALLTRAGIVVETITNNDSKEIQTAFGLKVKVDKRLYEINPDEYDFLIIPGGKYVSKVIDGEKDIPKLITKFNDERKLIGAICAAPRFLGRLGILDNKDFTCYPGCEKDMIKGVYHPEAKAIVSGNIITGRSAGTVVEFVTELVKYIKGEKEASSLLKEIEYN